MEHSNPFEGGDHQPLTDTDRIYHGITEALREERSIDHATARAIASQLHRGQESALYALASSGALVDGLNTELEAWRTEDTPVELEPWLDALDDYVIDRADTPGPVDGWTELWPTDPPEAVPDDEPGPGRSGTLPAAMSREVVTMHLPGAGDNQEIGGEQAPAAERIRASIDAAERDGHQIDDHTAREIARQLGPQPGSALEAFIACGVILNEEDELFRELYADWPDHDEEQQRMVEALRSYVVNRGSEGPVSHWCREESDRETVSGIRPEI